MADDLFTRDDEAEAVRALADARLVREYAIRQVCGAPRRMIGVRRRQLIAATAEVIAAEQNLAHVQASRRVRY